MSAPAWLVELPGHAVQTWDPGVENWFAAQVVQEVELESAKVPAGQSWHAVLLLAPITLENLPASQARHETRTLTPNPLGL